MKKFGVFKNLFTVALLLVLLGGVGATAGAANVDPGTGGLSSTTAVDDSTDVGNLPADENDYEETNSDPGTGGLTPSGYEAQTSSDPGTGGLKP